MKNLMRGGLVGLFILATGSAQATFVSADLWTPGDGILTYDTVFGLTWLNLSVTDGNSYVGIEGRIANDGDLADFRFATKNEIEAAWNRAGVNYTWHNPTANAFLDAVGTTWDSYNRPNHPGALGYYAETNSVSYRFIASLGRDGSATTENLFGFNPTQAYEEVGAFLVRESRASIPEPATVTMMLTSLCLLGLARRRRNHA